MSFDTYINIVITAWVTIICSLLGLLLPVIIPEKPSKNCEMRGKRKKRSKGNVTPKKFTPNEFIQKLKQFRNALIVVIVAGLIVFVITTIIYVLLKPTSYNETINKAEFEFGNRNYIEAARYYNEAASVAYNTETEAMAIYCEGACYLQMGLQANGNNYFSLALGKYYSIIDNKKYADTAYYQDALIDTTFALRELYGKWDNEDLYSIIQLLEGTYNFDDVEAAPSEDIDLMNKVSLAIAIYYKYAANEAFGIEDKENAEIFSDKAIYYYRIVCHLTPQADRLHFKKTDLLYIYTEISELMIKGAISSKNFNGAVTDFLNTVKFCESAIDTFEASEKDSEALNSFLRLKVNLGKSYYLMSGLLGDEYLSKAYNVLSPLLHLNANENTEYVLLDAGYYSILTKKCTSQEIDIILDRYERQIERFTIEDEKYLTVLQSTLEACRFILDIYGENERALERSESLSKEVDTLLSVYNK